ncbi:NUDIX domain-containing protein [Streptomyces canus]|uniref:NUDIX domain-containing protein n=1 Tax=Streptomyces canus TaxID=58343 RepID=UPI0027856D84|nr:NUDIX domain-containing protein [Streptomyces canus]MDQ1065431.1 8-oxo-dGTP pyrophosphatase MutT (NUDIX family) [Streptomyces canus]
MSEHLTESDDGSLVVAAAVIIRSGRLLVVSKTAAHEVFYLPGGKPDPGEDLETALLRELREELGLVPWPSAPSRRSGHSRRWSGSR